MKEYIVTISVKCDGPMDPNQIWAILDNRLEDGVYPPEWVESHITSVYPVE
jgi:hypothetical protein